MTAKAFNYAVMPQEGSLRLERSRVNMGDHRIRIGSGAPGAYAEQDRTTVEVKGRRLDAVLEGEPLSNPLVLKVDTQGAEVQVLRSATGLLPRVDHAVLEFWPYGLRRMGDSPDDFFQLISAFPFGAVIGAEGLPALGSVGQLVARLRELPDDGRSVQHVDVLVSRTATLG